MSGRFNLQDYVTVQDRIRQFWAEYPDGRIETNHISPIENFTSCRYRAAVYKHKDDIHPSATGWAFEHAGDRGPNQTSHEENCETSAIGRALANMGYATSQKDRPSREEMAKVARGPKSTQPAYQVPNNVDAATGEILSTHDQLAADIKRLISEANACQSKGALRLIGQDAERLGLLSDDEVVGALSAAKARLAPAEVAQPQQQFAKA